MLGLVKSVYFNDFYDEFVKYNRVENFSFEGKKALYDYLEELSEDLGESIELDIISICCEFTEYESVAEYNDDYNTDFETIDEIRDETIVIDIEDTDSFIVTVH